jgi:hypothetical protein
MKWPKEYQEVVASFKRRLKGYWSVGELARFLGVTNAAVLMQINRGKLTPIDRASQQPVFFEDQEVAKYLSEPYGGGRKRKKPEPTEAAK